MTRSSFALLFCVLLLFAVGLVMVFNTTSAEVLDRGLDRNTAHALIKQIAYSVVGMIGAFLVWKTGYQRLLKWSGPLLLIGTLLRSGFHSRDWPAAEWCNRWINVVGHSFQPSEVVKYLIPLYAISVLSTSDSLALKDFLSCL
jgi:cell division protein FtsW